MGDEVSEKYTNNAPSWLYILDHKIHQLLPVVIFILIGYLGIYFFTDITHVAIEYIENAILGYFVAEVGIAYILYEDRWAFLKDKWVNILLIIPFLATFRAMGRLGQALNATRGLEAANMMYIAETPAISRGLQQLPKLQKMGHGLLDLPKAMKKLKKGFSLGIISAVIATFLRRERNKSDETEHDK